MEVVTDSAAATQGLGQELAQRLKGGEIIGLVGDLGSGKTTFVQGLAKALGVKKRIISPTFIFIRPHPLPSGRGVLYHVDLYRIRGLDDVKGLGLEEIWSESENITVIEWAEKIKEILPKKAIMTSFEYLGRDKRKIKIPDI